MYSQDVATDKSRLVTYCQPEVKKKLERLAEVRVRSISNLIESILVEAVNKAEQNGEISIED